MVQGTRTKEAIIEELERRIRHSGAGYSGWYVGVTDDPRRRLFDEHQVDRNGVFRWAKEKTPGDAREIERLFLAKGCKGKRSRDEGEDFVYGYLVTGSTIEEA